MIQLLYMCSQSANKVLRIYEARTKDGNYAIPRTGHSSLPVAKKWENSTQSFVADFISILLPPFTYKTYMHIKIQISLSLTNNSTINFFYFYNVNFIWLNS